MTTALVCIHLQQNQQNSGKPSVCKQMGCEERVHGFITGQLVGHAGVNEKAAGQDDQ
jgi:hypothetical protein